jgi:tetratricopeptide repeat protein
MSVIFRTLKRLRSNTPEKEEEINVRRGRKIYSFRDILFSPASILLVTLIIFFAGYLAIYGVGYLANIAERPGADSVISERDHSAAQKEGGKEKGKPSVQANHLKTGAHETSSLAEQGGEIPPPPKQVSDPGQVEDKIYYHDNDIKTSASGESVQIRYRPPELQSKQTAKTVAMYQGPPEPQKLTDLQANKFKSKQPEDAPLITENRRASKLNHDLNAGLVTTSKEAKKTGTILPQTPVIVSGEINEAAKNKASPFSGAGNTFNDRRTVSPREPPNPKKPETGKDDRSQEYKIYLTNVEKGLKTARLVAEITEAIRQDNNERTDKLLDQLSVLKGVGNGYVLNLRAYRFLLQKNYQAAAYPLNKVLEENKDDLEAGVNMAIVEIGTNRFQAARKRLLKLRSLYPENIRVTELIQKIR